MGGVRSLRAPCFEAFLGGLSGGKTRLVAQETYLLRNPYGSFRKEGLPYLEVLIVRILLFRVLSWGPLFSEIPINRGHSTEPQKG